jgi:hypothetical protein
MKAVLTKVGNRARRLRARILHPNAPWERFYAVRNPWKFDRPGEIYRFSETNRIIREEIGRVGSLLEIGSAEGHQTEWLLRVADRVHGIDISATAVKRAKAAFAKNPKATFSVGALPASNLDLELAELVVVSEIIYYVAPEELHAAFDSIERLGQKRLMTIYLPCHTDAIEQLLLARKHLSTKTLSWAGEFNWLVAWW